MPLPDLKKPGMPPMTGMPTDDDPEESQEGDAISRAFDAIRKSVDEAEKGIVEQRFRKPEPGDVGEEGT